jgi:hypothetical protein
MAGNRWHDAILLPPWKASRQVEKLDIGCVPACMSRDAEHRCGIGGVEINDDMEPFSCLKKAVLIAEKCM